ncbi:hypothetical protein HZH68_009219 [Vespula germanica]|uniref:Uncharacterized protein n=1 Tax=Vespula germanica TaxID=30212 RepID=A0A834JV14_VESGE|nr:hypothetical protein HZH68_009219 [Vespula germanica]
MLASLSLDIMAVNGDVMALSAYCPAYDIPYTRNRGTFRAYPETKIEVVLDPLDVHISDDLERRGSQLRILRRPLYVMHLSSRMHVPNVPTTAYNAYSYSD